MRTDEMASARGALRGRGLKSSWGAVQESWTDPVTGMDFVRIAAGSFWMGAQKMDPDATLAEMPRHRVTITNGYWIGKYPVTQSQWMRIMRVNPSFFKGADLPVERVSWEDCQEFLVRLNRFNPSSQYLLPTEAQWEFACRAGSRSRFSWGDQSDCARANYGLLEVGAELMVRDCLGSNPGATVPVGAYPPNDWGVYDMHGNVWEWCEDAFEEYAPHDLTDPLHTSGSDRVRRGGGWANAPAAIRSSYRDWLESYQRSADLGFRIVRYAIDSCKQGEGNEGFASY